MSTIIPVIDLKSGTAVTGKSGNRKKYRELKSIYSNSSDPIEIAFNLKKHGAKEIYVADLDAIEKEGFNLELIKKINQILPIMLDCGIKNEFDFNFALEFARKIVIGTETLNNINELHNIYDKYPNERIVISVDIKNNELLCSNELNITLDELIEELKIIKPKEIILLDLSNVGTNLGFNMNLLTKFESLKKSIIIGGGITPKQLKLLNYEGIEKVLIGTSLHSGKIKIR